MDKSHRGVLDSAASRRGKGQPNRRTVLRSIGVAITTVLAGCSGEEPEESAEPPETTHWTTTTTVNREATVTVRDHENRNLLPIVTEDNRERSARIKAKVKDLDGIESIVVRFDNGHMDQPKQVHEDSGGGEQIPVVYDLPQRLIGPGENTFTTRVTDQKERTQQYTSTFTPETQTWKVDTPHSDYSTDRKWDNLQFNQPLEAFNGNTIKEQQEIWNDEMVYPTLIADLRDGDKQQIQEQYKGSKYGSSVEYPNSEEDDGTWNLNDFQNTDRIQEILSFGRNALHVHYLENNFTNWSTENDHLASTLQKICNELHDENPDNENIIETTYVNEGNHGTVMAYADPEKTDTEYTHFDGETHGEFNWWFVDTTDNWTLPINNDETKVPPGARGGYNAFIQGYKGEEQVSDTSRIQTYEQEKKIAVHPLLGFIDRSDTEQIDKTAISISDPVLEQIYNKHIPEGESGDPIIDMAMKASQLQIETGEHVQVYGDNLEYNEEDEVFEGVEYAINEGNIYSLHNMSMDAETRLTKDRVDRFLEEAAA